MTATINAAEKAIDINFADYQTIDANATAVLADNELTVSYNLGAWGASGVEFALDNLDNITNIGFDFKGDASVETWVSFFPYLKDAAGNRFYSKEADLNISTWMSEWSTKKYMPADALWTSATPGAATAATFAIRNVKVYIEDIGSALDNTQVKNASTKVVENGQVYILRDGVRYNLLGSVVE